jgi:hypothetical protein
MVVPAASACGDSIPIENSEKGFGAEGCLGWSILPALGPFCFDMHRFFQYRKISADI